MPHFDAKLSQVSNYTRNRLGGESIREAAHVLLNGTVVGEELDVSTVDLDAATSLALEVLLAAERGEAPVLGDNDLLATRELVLGAAESLKSDGTVWGALVGCLGLLEDRRYILESRVRRDMMI